MHHMDCNALTRTARFGTDWNTLGLAKMGE